MYRSNLKTRDKGGAVAAVIAIHAALLFAFLHLSGRMNIADPQSVLRVFDIVIRHMVVRVDEELAAAERARVRRKTDMAERRTRRGLPPEPTDQERRRHAEDDDDGDSSMDQMFRGGDR